MNFTKSEKIILIILSVLLLAGAERFYVKRSRPFHEITVITDGIREELTLEEVNRKLKESRKIDINSAVAVEITSVPGIGAVLAARIVEYRNIHGIFRGKDDLLKVPGIGEKKLEGMGEYLEFGERGDEGGDFQTHNSKL